MQMDMLSKRRCYQLQTTIHKQNDEVANKSDMYFSWKGLLLAVLSSCCYSVDAVLVKSMKNLDPIQLAVYRFIALFVLCLPEVVKCRENPFGPKDVRFFLLLRGALGGFNILLAYTSYHYLPLGETFIITSSTPIFVTFGACVFLKEPCGIFHSILVFFTVVGIIFATKVPSSLLKKDVMYTTENIYGILTSLGVLLCRTGMILSTRRAKKADHSIMMFNYSWISCVEGIIVMLVLTDFKWHRCCIQWIYILLIGIFSYLGQTFLTLSLKCEFAGTVSTIMAAVNIILSFLFQTIIFHDIPDYFTITGAIIVALCIVLTGFRKWVSAFPENSLLRQSFRWIMV